MSDDISPAHLVTSRVVHKRLRPRAHALSYRVFHLLVDVDRIAEACRATRLLSYNRFNLLSVHDRDLGRKDGEAIAVAARRTLMEAGFAAAGWRILLLTCPRVLGYTFNPLSVYFAIDGDGRLQALIYEVSNTFGERRSYVVAAGPEQAGGVYAHACLKRMEVSPFTPFAGRYGFRVTKPDATVVVGVMLHDADGPLIKTHMRGEREVLSDAAILEACWRLPFVTMKIIAAIHFEALKLWLKGVPLLARVHSPRYSATVASKPVREIDA